MQALLIDSDTWRKQSGKSNLAKHRPTSHGRKNRFWAPVLGKKNLCALEGDKPNHSLQQMTAYWIYHSLTSRFILFTLPLRATTIWGTNSVPSAVGLASYAWYWITQHMLCDHKHIFLPPSKRRAVRQKELTCYHGMGHWNSKELKASYLFLMQKNNSVV